MFVDYFHKSLGLVLLAVDVLTHKLFVALQLLVDEGIELAQQNLA